MTNKQRIDVETCLYFYPNQKEIKRVKDEDITKFLEYSERGLHKDEAKEFPKGKKLNGFQILCQGKRWRGISMEMYEDGILDCSMPYYVILGGYGDDVPRSVVDFMKKEMFKGIDAKIIEDAYKKVLEDKNEN